MVYTKALFSKKARLNGLAGSPIRAITAYYLEGQWPIIFTLLCLNSGLLWGIMAWPTGSVRVCFGLSGSLAWAPLGYRICSVSLLLPCSDQRLTCQLLFVQMRRRSHARAIAENAASCDTLACGLAILFGGVQTLGALVRIP